MFNPPHDTDTRPQRFGWAPGNYSCNCHQCNKYFSGDKRATLCADCAYSLPTPPKNDVNATHWATLPDGTFLFYKVGDEVKLWLEFSKVWERPTEVPYTLYKFDDN